MKKDDLENANFAGGMKVREEEIGYSPEDMAMCGECGRSNPPDRASCIYCAATLGAPVRVKGELRVNMRALEAWENGHNVVLMGAEPDADLGSAAKLLHRERAALERALQASSRLPAARLESESDSAVVMERLGCFGLRTAVVSDVRIKAARQNVRIRALEFDGGVVTATDFNTLARLSSDLSDIVLLICGTLYESRSETIEQAKGKGRRKSLSSSETVSDERVMDIYFRGQQAGWQIRTKGFDFSGLGDQKGYLAVENFDRLFKKLNESAPGSRTLDEYSAFRDLLDEVWPPDVRTDFEGMKHAGLWKAGFSKQVYSSNFDQFTRYSRLQRFLI